MYYGVILLYYILYIHHIDEIMLILIVRAAQSS
jgi:hypothetical protein